MSSLAGSYNIVVVAVAGALAFFCFRIVLPSCFHSTIRKKTLEDLTDEGRLGIGQRRVFNLIGCRDSVQLTNSVVLRDNRR